MKKVEQHYFSPLPDVNVKIQSISESLRTQLYFFKTVSGVFSFKKIDLGTKILVNHIVIPRNKSKLWDLGCGYGVIGMVLGKESPKSEIFFTDINSRAIWSTKENIKINFPEKSRRFHVIKGSYFKPFEKDMDKFNAIFCNPPLKKGKKEFIKIIEKIPHYLERNGYFQFVIKKSLGAKAIYDELKADYTSVNTEVIAKKSGYWIFNITVL